MKDRLENKSILEIINNRIVRLNILIFVLLALAVLVLMIFFLEAIYRKYIDDKLDFVEYQFNSIVRNALKDIENFVESASSPSNALVVIEVNLEGKVESLKPIIRSYEDFYFMNDNLFKETLKSGEYISEFTKRFLTVDPVIAVSKKYNDKVYIALLALNEIYENSQALQDGQQLFFVDKNGFGVNLSQSGYSFVDFLTIESHKKRIPLLGLDYLEFNNRIHVFFQRKFPYGFRSIITIPFLSFIKPYLYYFVIFMFFLTFNSIIISQLLTREIKSQLKPIQDLSNHMIEASEVTPVVFENSESEKLGFEIKNLIHSFNKMVENINENRKKMSLAVKKLAIMNENMHSINTLLVLSEELFKKMILNLDVPTAILKEYINKVFSAVSNLKYFSYKGEFGNLEVGKKSGRSLVINREGETIQLTFKSSENNETIFFENTLAQEIMNFIRDLKLATKIQNLLKYDSLTGLFNRKHFDELFEREIIIANRYGRIFSFILIDLDNFKVYNDDFGHQFGDRILQKFSEILQESFRQSDILGRFGGDEFQILMLETPREMACDKIRKIRERITSLEVNGIKIKLYFSFGIAEFPKNGKNKDELFKVADSELYKTKRKHRKESSK